MKNTQKLSNSFFVYGVAFFSIAVYIFGFFAVVHLVNEASQSGIAQAFSENMVSTVLGTACLFLTAPIYKFTTTLRMLEATEGENGITFLTLYSPFFISDMPQADSKITVKQLKEVNQGGPFSRWVELHIEHNGSKRIVNSFMSPKSVMKLKNA